MTVAELIEALQRFPGSYSVEIDEFWDHSEVEVTDANSDDDCLVVVLS